MLLTAPEIRYKLAQGEIDPKEFFPALVAVVSQGMAKYKQNDLFNLLWSALELTQNSETAVLDYLPEPWLVAAYALITTTATPSTGL